MGRMIVAALLVMALAAPSVHTQEQAEPVVHRTTLVESLGLLAYLFPPIALFMLWLLWQGNRIAAWKSRMQGGYVNTGLARPGVSLSLYVGYLLLRVKVAWGTTHETGWDYWGYDLIVSLTVFALLAFYYSIYQDERRRLEQIRKLDIESQPESPEGLVFFIYQPCPRRWPPGSNEEVLRN